MIPVQRARWAWCWYDWANSGFATVIMAAVFPVYFAALIPPGGAEFPFWGRPIPAAALWGYVISASMLLVALTAPYLGALADRRGARRRLLILFTFTGAATTALLGVTTSDAWLAAGALFVLANFSFASANVFYNAFLPALAEGKELDRLSARGFALGYLGGGLLLALVFVLIQWHEKIGFADAGSATRFGFLLTGIWWLLFALPTFAFVREEPLQRPPAIPLSGIRHYLRTLGEIRRYPDLFRFLIAFLFYNDGIQTVIVVSSVFAAQELGLSPTSILACFLMIQFVAMPGALLFGRLAGKIGAKGAIQVSLALFTAVTIYAFFIRQEWEFWILAFAVALILGGSQAISRSLYGALLPREKSAEFFGFYAVSAKFASIFGPFIFALVTDLTRSARLSILAVGTFFIVGMILLPGVNAPQGQQRTARSDP